MNTIRYKFEFKEMNISEAYTTLEIREHYAEIDPRDANKIALAEKFGGVVEESKPSKKGKAQEVTNA